MSMRTGTSMKDDYFASMTSQFKRWDAQMVALTARLARLDKPARAAYVGPVKAMRLNRDVAFYKLGQIGIAGESSWRGLQTGVDAGWVAMRHAMEKVSAQSRERRG